MRGRRVLLVVALYLSSLLLYTVTASVLGSSFSSWWTVVSFLWVGGSILIGILVVFILDVQEQRIIQFLLFASAFGTALFIVPYSILSTLLPHIVVPLSIRALILGVACTLAAYVVAAEYVERKNARIGMIPVLFAGSFLLTVAATEVLGLGFHPGWSTLTRILGLCSIPGSILVVYLLEGTETPVAIVLFTTTTVSLVLFELLQTILSSFAPEYGVPLALRAIILVVAFGAGIYLVRRKPVRKFFA